jgi:uncharacterized protein YunC (DUF1805 family)
MGAFHELSLEEAASAMFIDKNQHSWTNYVMAAIKVQTGFCAWCGVLSLTLSSEQGILESSSIGVSAGFDAMVDGTVPPVRA